MSDLRAVLGIEHPILLGPFGGLSSVRLTAAVSEAGGFGSFGLYGHDGERIRETGAELWSTTDRPFGVNIWLPTGDEAPPNAQHMIFAQVLQRFYEAVGIDCLLAPSGICRPSTSSSTLSGASLRPC